VPFMFGRDLFGLCLLYGLGLAFLYHRLYFTLKARGASGPFGRWLLARWENHPPDEDRLAGRMTVFGILYLLAFALVLSLVGLRSGDGHGPALVLHPFRRLYLCQGRLTLASGP
jgi:hypothetical protein